VSGPNLSETGLQGVHVLIVEDNIEAFVEIQGMLAFIGITSAEWKSSGAGVVQLAEALARTPDLILLDLGLPNEDGFEILRRLRAIPRFSKTRIVAVTGSVSVEDMRRAQAAGFDGFLGKPLDFRRFPSQIQRILKGESVWERM